MDDASSAARRLIETALPLDAVNRRSVQEGQGTISPIHLWWSRKPAAACRASLLAAVLRDAADPIERADRLRLVAGAAAARAGDPALDQARAAVADACAGAPPTVFDPFSGSAAIAAEAQRLGLPSVAADLNPVAVVIARALLDIPARFRNRPPARPGAGPAGADGLGGLTADVLHYGERVRDEVRRRIGRHYPDAPDGGAVTAWLWARTVTCPNPACARTMPLVHSFRLSERPGRLAWVVPDGRRFRLGPDAGCPEPPEGTVRRTSARCVHCGHAVPLAELRPLVRSSGFGQALLAMVVGRGRSRGYAQADARHERAGLDVRAPWSPDTPLPSAALGFSTANYGLRRHRDLYTPRQLLALACFADAIRDLRAEVRADAVGAGWDDGLPLRGGGCGAAAYSEAISLYLALALDRAAARWCTFARWHRTRQNIEHPFASPGLHMLWDFAEANPFSTSTGNWMDAVEAVAKALRAAPAHDGPVPPAVCVQRDAALPPGLLGPVLVCTDPPYYDNLPYADMADLFYVWLRPVLRDVYPDLFATILSPKTGELVADPRRHGGREAARAQFMERMEAVWRQVRGAAGGQPVLIFYAFRESGGASGRAEGWEALLESLFAAGLQVTATWPLRTEHAQRLRTRASNTLATSVLLVCRARPDGAPAATRREFTSELRGELTGAVDRLTAAGIAPFDLAQAAVGPGMAVFSRYAAVLDGGAPMDVATALRLIGEALGALLHGATAGLDAASRFCLAWVAAHGWRPAAYGLAEAMARTHDVAVERVVRGGDLIASGGEVRLADAPPRHPESAWGVLQCVAAALRDEGRSAADAALAAGGLSRAQVGALARRAFTACLNVGEGERARIYGQVAEAVEAAPDRDP